jgi:hypothetical protein
MVISDDAKKFAIARQIEEIRKGNPPITVPNLIYKFVANFLWSYDHSYPNYWDIFCDILICSLL